MNYKHTYIVEDGKETKTMQLDECEIIRYLDNGYRLKRRRALPENNLYVTAGCRAGTMDMMNQIDLPTGVDGEEELAIFVEDAIGEWSRTQPDMPFDEFIENRLLLRFGADEPFDIQYE
jgi:hypothetical protein